MAKKISVSSQPPSKRSVAIGKCVKCMPKSDRKSCATLSANEVDYWYTKTNKPSKSAKKQMI